MITLTKFVEIKYAEKKVGLVRKLRPTHSLWSGNILVFAAKYQWELAELSGHAVRIFVSVAWVEVQLSIMESYTWLALVRQAVTSKETFRTRPAWEVNAPLAQKRADIQHTNIHTDHQSIHFMNLHYIQLLHLCNLQLELKSLLEYPKISCLLNHIYSLHYSVTV